MAWIESHQSLITHRKTLRACAILGISRPQLIGHLVMLWSWALDNADENGVLGDVTDKELSMVMECCEDVSDGMLVGGLMAAGFIDRIEGQYAIHDWQDYAGRLIAQREAGREANRERQRRFRERHQSNANEITPLLTASNGPTSPHLTQPTQPTVPTSPNLSVRQLEAQLDIRLSQNQDQWLRLVTDNPNLNVNVLYRDWLLWVRERVSERRPKDAYRAFKGFLRKKETA